MLGGVCATIAAASNVPCWIIRLATLLLAIKLPIIILVIYLVLAVSIHRRRNRLRRNVQQWHDQFSFIATPPPNPFSAMIDRLAHRFATLDQRLADLERTAGQRNSADRRHPW
jgi:phage shock protein PspC (stress-responsive transcriptional regulator)